ncbi:YhfX family PLP-dependent enzyme [Ktedonosporobacter rubrisoli]|uniref:YhfX family PLP-dependent enzyme n=1 Tax=Ktedonosporobacter rubrisoli TaxID=2509675 RepID=A0A4P6K3G7_KTERU|nr:alanine racemase [Ktedonosporobacter rubrisoli]QBD82585.1 YhfX family PLP-dependent enzyme [Ktedonosporobacter rubrisoli]
MFLNAVKKRNPELIGFAAELHRAGAIPPNTFVIDRGAVRRNAERLAQKASELNLQLYFMAKQIGYDEQLISAILPAIPAAVAVDWMGAEAQIAQGVPVKHVGHLVPIPFHSIPHIMAKGQPEVWTLLDLDAAKAVSEAAQAQERTQQILLRINGGQLFPGQEGGFATDTITDIARRIASLPGLKLAGVTSYPCFTWDENNEQYIPSSNLQELLIAAERLREAGFEMKQINTPGNTSLSVLPLLAKYGATHGEPGHALTGTTPEQSLGRCEEEPAAIYVSEVSAMLPSGQALAYGGGLYARAHARSALVGGSVEELMETEAIPVAFPPAQFIDYQCSLHVPETRHLHSGDTVIMAFRFQLFVLRSYRAIVEQDDQGIWRLLSLKAPE